MKKLFHISLLLLSLVFFLYTRTHKLLNVYGSSMEPTLYERNVCIANNVVTPLRGNIYVVVEPDTDRWAVKRLIGVPGDTVELTSGNTIVNGVDNGISIEGTWEDSTYVLGADEYLFLGDNREDSYDGRHWHRFVRRDEILYEVVFRVYPMSKIGRLE